jgi:ubiquinone/menaquinone biosynthesis C-methylase UbiE
MPAPDARPETYTHGHHESVLRSHRWRTVDNSAAYLVSQLRPGIRVLDVGCGPGTITVDLAARVAPGEVIGIDPATDALDAAREAADEAGVANVAFGTGDVYALEYDDASFDLVHAHQVLQHLADPVRALREMRRVCAPAGTVGARDSDYRAMTWHPAVPELDRWLDLYRAVARHNGGEPDAGRRLSEWARAAGFSTIEPSASVWCFATVEDREWWGGLWADRVVASAFADQAVAAGLTDAEELARIAAGWRTWAAEAAGWFAVLHGEIRCLP